jgi:hypothetical protein
VVVKPGETFTNGPHTIKPGVDALKAKLLDDANRGLIAEGAQVEGRVQVVKFTPAATPVMTLTVIYKAK